MGLILIWGLTYTFFTSTLKEITALAGKLFNPIYSHPQNNIYFLESDP